MARGYIYHITPDPVDLNSVDEGDFTNPDAIGADFCKTVYGIENCARIANLFKSLGLKVTPVDEFGDDLDEGKGHETEGWRIHAASETEMRDFKRAFFATRLEELKTVVSELDIDAFAQAENDVAKLEMLINNRFGDAIMLGGDIGATFKTFDSGVRSLSPDTDYYLSAKCVIMH